MDKKRYDIFVDESCHLENDRIPIMCIGYIKVPAEEYERLKQTFKEILSKHDRKTEIKWTKFSKANLPLYRDLVDFFFKSPLEFRAVLVKYKERLNHADFNQGSHDNFYYKMVYYLLRPNNCENDTCRVFIDIKDTRGRQKLKKIKEVFANQFKEDSSFKDFQHLHSDHNLFFQMADFFIGAITHKTRIVSGDIPNPTAHRVEFIEYLETRSGFVLNEGTEPWETKFNIFDHQPRIKN